MFLAMALVLISALFFAVNKKIKIFSLGLGVLSLWVLIMTAARLSFVAAVLGILTGLLLVKKYKFILLMTLFFTLVLIYPSQLRDRLISTVTVNLFGQGQRYEGQTEDQKLRSKLNIPTLAIKTSSQSAETSTFATSSATASDITPGEPTDTTQLGVYRSFAIRLNLEWPAAIRAFLKNPFLGTGYSSLGLATDNDFLRSLGEVGILGSSAFILILIEATRRVFKNLQTNDKFIKYFSAGSLALIMAFVVNALFIDVFEASKVASIFWMLLGANLATRNFK
ncbi:O-antigen ligase family protein [Candidatus Daviesbacteria bacterium]|nr:O-antigen ligase family protein [Candidatus Daviesbacteria bacterium]